MSRSLPFVLLALLVATALAECLDKSNGSNGTNGTNKSNATSAPDPTAGAILDRLAGILQAEEPSVVNQTIQAFCSSVSVQVVTDLAVIPFRIHELINFCPQPQASVLPQTCLFSTGALLAILSDLASFISLIAGSCNLNVPPNLQALCAVPGAAMLKPMGLVASAAGLMELACSQQLSLFQNAAVPPSEWYEWERAECGVEAAQVSNGIMALGLVLNNLKTDCDQSRLSFPGPLGTFFNATCAVDVGGVFQAFSGLAALGGLMSTNCEPTRARPMSLCSTSINVLINGLATAASTGAGLYAACVFPNSIPAGSSGSVDGAYLPIPWTPLVVAQTLSRMSPIVPGFARRLEQFSAQDFAARLEGKVHPKVLATLEAILAGPRLSGCIEEGVSVGLYDLYGHPMSIEESVQRCQARCASIESCAYFSYWAHDRHCHLHDVLAPRHQEQPLWTSGQAQCQQPPSISTCFEAHALYETDVPAFNATSAAQCQQLCQQSPSCAHFTFSLMTGKCSLAPKGSRRLSPVLFELSGPALCPSDPWISKMGALALALGVASLMIFSRLALWAMRNVQKPDRQEICTLLLSPNDEKQGGAV